MEIHQAETRHRGSQVQVDDILLAHPPQSLTVAHPGQGVHYLLIPWQLDAKPATHVDLTDMPGLTTGHDPLYSVTITDAI